MIPVAREHRYDVRERVIRRKWFTDVFVCLSAYKMREAEVFDLPRSAATAEVVLHVFVLLSERVPSERDLVGVMYESVKDSVAQSGVANHLVPFFYG